MSAVTVSRASVPDRPAETEAVHRQPIGVCSRVAAWRHRVGCDPGLRLRELSYETGIFARLRSFAANILRFDGIHNVSDSRHRIAFGGISAILAMRVMY